MQTKYLMQLQDGRRANVHGRDAMRRMRKNRGAVTLARWEHSAWTEIVKGALRNAAGSGADE